MQTPADGESHQSLCLSVCLQCLSCLPPSLPFSPSYMLYASVSFSRLISVPISPDSASLRSFSPSLPACYYIFHPVVLPLLCVIPPLMFLSVCHIHSFSCLIVLICRFPSCLLFCISLSPFVFSYLASGSSSCPSLDNLPLCLFLPPAVTTTG